MTSTGTLSKHPAWPPRFLKCQMELTGDCHRCLSSCIELRIQLPHNKRLKSGSITPVQKNILTSNPYPPTFTLGP